MNILMRTKWLLIQIFHVRCKPSKPNSIHDSDKCRTIDVPLPTHRLASAALHTLQVDAELSPLVRRSFALISLSPEVSQANGDTGSLDTDEDKRVLRTEYKATTNRMLRVAVNGFMESLSVVIQIMEELDVDVLQARN